MGPMRSEVGLRCSTDNTQNIEVVERSLTGVVTN